MSLTSISNSSLFRYSGSKKQSPVPSDASAERAKLDIPGKDRKTDDQAVLVKLSSSISATPITATATATVTATAAKTDTLVYPKPAPVATATATEIKGGAVADNTAVLTATAVATPIKADSVAEVDAEQVPTHTHGPIGITKVPDSELKVDGSVDARPIGDPVNPGVLIGPYPVDSTGSKQVPTHTQGPKGITKVVDDVFLADRDVKAEKIGRPVVSATTDRPTATLESPPLIFVVQK